VHQALAAAELGQEHLPLCSEISQLRFERPHPLAKILDAPLDLGRLESREILFLRHRGY
jgi:hypothetical protein